jgi:hypothetical protein
MLVMKRLAADLGITRIRTRPKFVLFETTMSIGAFQMLFDAIDEEKADIKNNLIYKEGSAGFLVGAAAVCVYGVMFVLCLLKLRGFVFCLGSRSCGRLVGTKWSIVVVMFNFSGKCTIFLERGRRSVLLRVSV